MKAIRGELEDQFDFVKWVFQDGLEAFEPLLVKTRETRTAGFTVRSQVTIVDVCLILAVKQGSFYRLEMEFAPNVMEICNKQQQMGAFQAADWKK